MSWKIDHIIISVNNIQQAIEDYRLLGFTVIAIGNPITSAIIYFINNTYILIRTAPSEMQPSTSSTYSDLQSIKEGVTGYALQTDDLIADTNRLRDLGVQVSQIREYKMTVADSEITGKITLINNDFKPYLIQYQHHLASYIPDFNLLTRHKNRAVGIRNIEIIVQDLSVSYSNLR